MSDTAPDIVVGTELEVAPDPQRIVEGLRDTGYEFNTAIADIVDNSIAASASAVDITVKMDLRGTIRISIADNGTGMDPKGLVNAMRYGSKRRPDPRSLGKFGLGLKTASTAFCRRLSVSSRPTGSASALRATWDLDHIAAAGWKLLLEAPDPEAIAHLDRVAPSRAGTVVTWENVDRLLKQYQDPGGSHARNALRRQTDALKEHLAMVYQRFLDPNDERAPTVQIRLNGDAVVAWDPFVVTESELVADETMPVELGEGPAAATFRVRAYVLPRREEFSSEDAWQRARLGNERQGIYIYREERLIHAADWLGMFQKEPHGTLLRVEFSFDHLLDEAFHIDIKKSQILLNEDLWHWLNDEFLPAPRRAANERYRKGQKKKIAETAKTSHESSNAVIASKEDGLGAADVKVIDAASGEVEVSNKQGRIRLRLKVGSPMRPNECFVQPVESIEDGLLWEPVILDTHKAVRINVGHPYYAKVYVPNLASGVTVQGMDSLLWALCAAELGTVSNATRDHFSELRYEVSRILRRLIEDMPDPVDTDA